MPRAKKTEVATRDEDAMMVMDEEHSGSGMGEGSMDDMPRLAILQKLSFQLDKQHGEYIPDAKEGQVCAIGADYVADEVEFLACRYAKIWLEWPEQRGSGAPTVHTTPAAFNRAREESDAWPPRTESGSIIQEVSQFTGLVIEPNGVTWPAQLPMTSTQLRKARKWLMIAHRNRIKSPSGKVMPAPLWAQSYVLGSAVERNDQGAWHGWTIGAGRRLDVLCADLDLDLQACMDQAKAVAQMDAGARFEPPAEEEAF